MSRESDETSDGGDGRKGGVGGGGEEGIGRDGGVGGGTGRGWRGAIGYSLKESTLWGVGGVGWIELPSGSERGSERRV